MKIGNNRAKLIGIWYILPNVGQTYIENMKLATKGLKKSIMMSVSALSA